MSKYVIEGIGFNDGSPFPIAQTDNGTRARVLLNETRLEHPRIGHRLIEVLEEHPPIDRSST